jgi:hypothetical protein
LLQRLADPDHLRMHNTDAMQPHLYRRLALDCGMRLEHVRYIDGVDPTMIKAQGRPMGAVLLPLQIWRRLGVSDRVNHRLLSSYLLMTFARPS